MALYSPKLAELRAKTDHDLKLLTARSLDHCRELAGRAEWVEAERLYARTAATVSFIEGIPADELSHLRTRLAAVRSILDRAALAA